MSAMKRALLHVVTYNIHKGFSQFNQNMMVHELREQLRALGPDIVFLQEVQGMHSRHARRIDNWPLEAHMGDILIMRMLDREARQNRIAMVPVVVDDVASVGCGLPYIFGEKVLLRLFRPVVYPAGMAVMHALNFLQEDDVRPQSTQLLAQFMHHHVLVELRESFVDVVGNNVELCAFHGAHDTASILSSASLASTASCSGTLI